LTADAGDVERIAEVVNECKRMGIHVWPPSVNESFGNFTVIDEKNIRFGLYSIKNFGSGVADSIIAARKEGGKFKDVADFLTRVPHKNLNKKSFESVIQCGAFDDMQVPRGELMANLETMLDYHRQNINAPKNQSSLFGASVAARVNLSLEPAQPVSMETLLQW